MKEYIFAPYDMRYPMQFAREKAKLKKMLPFALKIEHFGSTAVKGLKGKGVLDVYVLVPKRQFTDTKEELSKFWYEYFGTKEMKGGSKMVFRKGYRYGKYGRMVNVHVATVGIKDFTTVLAFRDALRGNKLLRKEYEMVKKVAVNKTSNNGEFNEENTRIYVDAKSDFILKHRKISL